VALRVMAHDDDVNAACYAESDNNNTIISGSDDCTIKLWDRRLLGKQKEPVGVLLGHMEGITHLCSKGDGRYFISNSKDQTIKLWDIRSMCSAQKAKELSVRRGTFDYRYGEQSFGRNRRDVLNGRNAHPSDMSLMSYRGHKVFQTLIRAYFSPSATTGQKYIYSGSYDGTTYIYDALTGEVVETLKGHLATVRDVSWHPDEPIIASASWDGSVVIWK